MINGEIGAPSQAVVCSTAIQIRMLPIQDVKLRKVAHIEAPVPSVSGCISGIFLRRVVLREHVSAVNLPAAYIFYTYYLNGVLEYCSNVRKQLVRGIYICERASPHVLCYLI